MHFDFTLEELWQVAEAIAAHVASDGHTVTPESTPWSDAPFVTTLHARRRAATAPHVLIEVQGELNYSDRLKELRSYLFTGARHAELYFAIGEDATIHAGTFNRLVTDGIGLMLVSTTGTVAVRQQAKNPALIVNPNPTLRYGAHATEVRDIIRKFNDGHRQDAVRDICELVERLTNMVGTAAIRRGVWTISQSQFDSKDWQDKINALASSAICRSGAAALCDHRMQTDLHALRNARNLVDHPPRTLRERYQRERQYSDKLMLGSRMVSDLVMVKTRVGRL